MKIKPESTQSGHPEETLFKQRRSTRAFSDREVPISVLKALFEAAHQAPSSFNEQPWRFLFARRGEPAFEQLADCLMPANRLWASKAAVLILTAVSNRLSASGRPNRYAWHDAGMALQNLLLQATRLGLASHPMGGFDADEVRKTFQLPEDWEPVTITALGFPGNPATLPPELRAREKAPRKRKPLSEVVFHGAWDLPIFTKGLSEKTGT